MGMPTVRLMNLLALAAATALLAVGAWVMQSGVRIWQLERGQAAAVQARLQGARALLPEIERREAMARQVTALSEQVARTGFDPAQWGERRIRRSLTSAPRVDVARFIDQLAHTSSGSLLVADYFELNTVSKGGGLFQVPAAGDEGLALGLTATQYFQSNRANR
jgi:hypothetical protein